MADDTLSRVPGQRPARVSLRLKQGGTLSALAEVRKGDPERAMTAAEKHAKCIGLMTPYWGEKGAQAVMAAIDELPGVSQLKHWADGLRFLIV